jgi:hypothetical protein
MNKTYHERGKLVDGYRVRKHPSYTTWANMKTRCDKGLINYGERGITYCDDWVHFENFARDMGIKPSAEHSIDRIDNDGNYCKDNCRWALRWEQSLNRRVFKNNLTGFTGVKKHKNHYTACFSHKNVKYEEYGYLTADEANVAYIRMRDAILDGTYVKDEFKSRASNKTSSVKGINRHKDGCYVVRSTLNGVRTYVGYFKTFDEAVEGLLKWKQENK